MIRFFRGTGFGPIVLLVLIAGALWAEFFIAPPPVFEVTGENVMPLWAMLRGVLSGMPFLAVTVSFVFVLLLVFLMVRFNTSVFFIPRRTYIPGLVYLVLFSIFPGQMILNPALPSALLIMAGLWRMIAAYRRNGVAYNFFDAAMIISLAGLIYADALWFIILVFVGALILRTPDMREILAAFFGAVLPWALYFAVWFLTGNDPSELSQKIYNGLFEASPSVYWSRTLIILLIVIAINFLPAFYMLLTGMSTQKIKSRKTFTMLIWMMFLSGVIFAVVPSVSVEITAIAAIPVTYIISYYYVFTRHVGRAELLFLATVAMLVVSRFWPY